MPKALIVFASMTGTTEGIAEILAEELEKLKVRTLVEECSELYPDEFLEVDICIVATYTYGSDGALPEEAEDFFYDLGEMDLTGKVFGVLGSGDKIYPKFCPAVDDFDAVFEKIHAVRGAEPLKINLAPDDKDREDIKRFAESLVETYHQRII